MAAAPHLLGQCWCLWLLLPQEVRLKARPHRPPSVVHSQLLTTLSKATHTWEKQSLVAVSPSQKGISGYEPCSTPGEGASPANLGEVAPQALSAGPPLAPGQETTRKPEVGFLTAQIQGRWRSRDEPCAAGLELGGRNSWGPVYKHGNKFYARVYTHM